MKKLVKEKYSVPEICITILNCDIITYSETEEWEGPVVQAGIEDENK